jgi:type II secretory pathway component PulF
MSTFVYTAFDAKGKLFRGQVKEKSRTQALRRVKEMGLFPTSVKPRGMTGSSLAFRLFTL